MSLTSEQFGKAIVAAGLMTADELKAFWSSLPGDQRPRGGDALARLLVEQGKLTEFQTGELLSGTHGPLILGDYILLSKIGAGGMGQVFKAQHRHMDRVVAIKLLPAAVMKDADAVKRFQREVKAAAKLSHPNIVAALDARNEHGVWCLVMEYVAGRDLSQLLKERGPFSVNDAVDCVLQAARGLAYAHSKGVVHRDIKPGNLLLDAEGSVKILDMGLARIDSSADQADHQLTNTGAVMGTIDYMAPEQAASTHDADHRSDIYSLGCTLYRLLTGENVYHADTVVKKILAHMNSPVPSILDKRGDVPPAVDAIFQRMVAKSPEDRYQQTSDLVVELEQWRNPGATASFSDSSALKDDSKLRDFLKAVGAGGSSTSLSTASTPSAPGTDLTHPGVGGDVATDPQSEVVPRGAAPRAKPQATVRRGKKGPPVALIAGGVGALALVVALGVWVFVKDKDGNEVARIQVPEGGSVTVQQTDAGQTDVPAPRSTPTSSVPISFFTPTAPSPASVTEPPSSTGVVYLDDLAESRRSTHMNKLGRHGLDVTSGQPIVRHGRQVAHSLFTHPNSIDSPALVVYSLNGKFETFKATVGLYLSGTALRSASPLTFRVLGDGRELWKSPPLQARSDEATVSVPVAGVQELQLEVACGGDKIFQAHAVWFEPRLTPEGFSASSAAPPVAVAPFDAAQARVHQEAWANHLGTQVETVDGVGQKMILLPPGEFLMGSTDEQVAAALKVAEVDAVRAHISRIERRERPQHRVVLTKPFRMGATEVTVGQFKQFAAAAGYKTEAEQAAANDPTTRTYLFNQGDELPAVYISWNDAVAYCEWLTEQETGPGGSGDIAGPSRPGKYRLPTEAEWEYACRAGTTTQYSFADDADELHKYGWYAKERGTLHPGGMLLPNPFGLFDMHGNVQEWCGDYLDENWFSLSPVNDPIGPVDGVSRVVRSGNFNGPAILCRSAFRDGGEPSRSLTNKGFRVVAELDTTTPATTSQNAAGPWVEILPLVDPALDKLDIPNVTGANDWQIAGGELVFKSDGRPGKLLFPVRYTQPTIEWEIEFTRTRGGRTFNTDAPATAGIVSIMVDERDDGSVVFGGTSLRIGEGADIRTGVRSKLRIVAGRDGDDDRLQIFFDDRPVADWRGRKSDVVKRTPDEDFDTAERNGLWVFPDCDYVFHRVRVRGLDGAEVIPLRDAAVPPPAVAPAEPPPVRWPLAPSKPEDIAWLHDLKVRFTLRTGPDQEVNLKFGAAPPAGPATIVAVVINDAVGDLVTDEFLQRLATLGDLESLELTFINHQPTQVTKDGLPQLTALVHLRHLKLHRIGPAETDPEYLAAFQELESLGLQAVRYPWQRSLSELSSLRELSLVDETDLDEFEPPPRLTTIDLRGKGPLADREAAAREFATRAPWCRITVMSLEGKVFLLIEPTAPPPVSIIPPPVRWPLPPTPPEDIAWAQGLGAVLSLSSGSDGDFELLPTVAPPPAR